MTIKDLTKKGLRRTSARQKIIKLFSQPRAWTAGQLIKKMTDTDRATIFRNLKALEKNHIITALHSHHGETLFELADKTHHAHQFCLKCGTAECVPCPIKNNKDHNLEFFKTCKICIKHTT